MNLPANKTRIVATIGPASQSVDVMEAMLRAGMNVARLNFSHGDFYSHARVIANLREASSRTGLRLAILADLSGPKMRLGDFGVPSVELKTGDRFTLTTEDVVGDPERVSVSFARLPEVVSAGDSLFLNDGYVQLRVERVQGRNVECVVMAGGELSSRKGLNLPGIDLGMRAFTERDHAALAFALEHGVDAVSQSFVENAADVEMVRAAARELGHDPFLIAKIERSRALVHLDEILAAADAVMIARGDLGVEVPIERIALVQKDIARRAGLRAKPVITATQMLESMTSHRLPTRAEATDVANAVLDGTDAVMLSGESAVGRYPVEAVAMLARIAAEVDPMRVRIRAEDLYRAAGSPADVASEHLVAASVEATLAYARPAAVFVPTLSGASARRMSRHRLPVWTIAVSPNPDTCQKLQFSYGVMAVCEPADPAAWSEYVRSWTKEHGLDGRFAILVAGPWPGDPKANHRVEFVDL
jgi:pyruvate kinase